jgi:hypothetical protein
LKTNLACVLQIAKLKTTKQVGKGCWLFINVLFCGAYSPIGDFKKKSEK